MACLVNDSRNTKKVVADYQKQTLDRYATYLNQVPVRVQYLTVDRAQSLRDVSLHNVEEILGADSPLKYDRIIDFPLYDFQKLEISIEDITGSAVVLPDFHRPEIDDLIVVKNEELQYEIFRIDTVERERVRGKMFHRITFYLYVTHDIQQLESQISNCYQAVSDKVDALEIVPVNVADQIAQITDYIDELQDYMFTFFNDCARTYEFRYSTGEIVYDHSLNNFIVTHNIYKRSSPYRNEMFLRETKFNLEGFNKYTKHSLMYAVEKQTTKFLGDFNGVLLCPYTSPTDPYAIKYEVATEPLSAAIPPGGTKGPLVRLIGNFAEYATEIPLLSDNHITDEASYLASLPLTLRGTLPVEEVDNSEDVTSDNTEITGKCFKHVSEVSHMERTEVLLTSDITTLLSDAEIGSEDRPITSDNVGSLWDYKYHEEGSLPVGFATVLRDHVLGNFNAAGTIAHLEDYEFEGSLTDYFHVPLVIFALRALLDDLKGTSI